MNKLTTRTPGHEQTHSIYFFLLRAFVPSCLILSSLRAAQTQPTKTIQFPHIQVDVPHKQIRLECEALNCDAPLEMLACVAGTHDYESVLRTGARPSQLHLALLMLGAKPGEPAHYSQADKRWIPPTGDDLNIDAEFLKNGTKIHINACDLMRDIKTHHPMPRTPWVFAGSKVINGTYTADVTGYILTVVNFDWSTIDVPALRSNSDATLQWERNPDIAPPANTPVILIITPKTPATRPSAVSESPAKPTALPWDP